MKSCKLEHMVRRVREFQPLGKSPLDNTGFKVKELESVEVGYYKWDDKKENDCRGLFIIFF